MLFFSEVVSGINSKYPTLFGKGDEEEFEEGEGFVDEEEVNARNDRMQEGSENPFTNK